MSSAEGAASTRRWVLAATIVGSAMAFIDGSVVNVALPALQAEFHASVADLQWVVEAYSLFLSALLLVGGSLGDMLGRRKIYAIGVALFAVASLACALAGSMQMLIAARAVQGIGGALLVPGGLAIITATFPSEERGQAIGTWSGWSAMTTAVGPVIGGWAIEHLSWRWAFLINLPLAIAVLVLVWLHMPESRGEQGRLDFVGAVLATLGLGGVIYGLIEAGPSGPQWLPLGVGLGVLVAFVGVEGWQSKPMVPLSLFRSRNFSGANLLTLFLYGALSGLFFFMPLVLIQVQHYSATAAGAATLPFVVLMFGLSRWAGGLVEHVGARLPLVAGPLISAVGFSLFGRIELGSGYWTVIFPAVMVLGFGMTVTVAPLTTTVMGAVDKRHVGIASGINNAVSRAAGLLAIAIFGLYVSSLFNASLDAGLTRLALAPTVQEQVVSQRTRLAAIEVPSLPAPQQAAVREVVDTAFLQAFRALAHWMAGLAVLSALAALLLIEGSARSHTSP